MKIHGLSTIIPIYDNFDVVVKHVEGCMAGSVIPDEIIVVNDGGDKSLLEKLKQVEKKTKLIYARINEDIPWNTNGAYNLGMFISKGDYLSLEDCDHIPYPDFYEKALEKIKEGFDRVISHGRTLVKREDLQPYKAVGCHSLVGLYKREILLKMKGYDERFGGHYGWNASDVLRRLNKLGCKTGSISGFYMVSDGMSIPETRPMMNGKPKMEKENAWQLRRNENEGGQVSHPILNFSYEITYL